MTVVPCSTTCEKFEAATTLSTFPAFFAGKLIRRKFTRSTTWRASIFPASATLAPSVGLTIPPRTPTTFTSPANTRSRDLQIYEPRPAKPLVASWVGIAAPSSTTCKWCEMTVAAPTPSSTSASCATRRPCRR